jgi:hypothetical protein
MSEGQDNAQLTIHNPNEDVKELVGGLTRVDSPTTVGNVQGLEPVSGNRFIWFEQLEQMTPHVSIPLTKLAFSLVKNIRFVSGDTDDPDEEAVKEFEIWADHIGFRAKIQGLAKLIIKNGTFVGQVTEEKAEEFNFEPTIMQYTTLLPKSVKAGEKPDTVMTAPVERAYINEGDEKLEQEIKNDKLIYGAFFPYDKPITDVMSRTTYGIYGTSLLEALRQDVEDYLDLKHGYVEYIRKYGAGRYHINYKALEKLLESGDVATVISLITKLKEQHELIKANEDIIGCGFEVKNLDQTGTNLDVVGYKGSLETDIQIGLLQQPLTMGRAEGTTYAAGYVSEADRLIVLEGLQQTIQDIVNKQIIDKRLDKLGKDAGKIKVVFEELSQPSVVFKDLIEAFDKAIITRREVRSRGGFRPKVADDEMIEGRDLVKNQTHEKTDDEKKPDGNNKPKAPDVTPSIT